MRALYALVVPVLLASSGFVTAGYIDDNTTFSLAISVLRGAVGPHARALRIEADVNGIEIHAQDAHNRSHIHGWRYGTVTYMGVPLRRLTGPEPIDPALVNPDIEANLFDLDSIDFAATPKLIHDSIARANLQDPAAVTRMEIARRSFILPQPTSGEVRCRRQRLSPGTSMVCSDASARSILMRRWVRRRPPLLLLPTSIGRSSENSKSARSTKPPSSMDWSIVSVLQSPRISQLDLF